MFSTNLTNQFGKIFANILREFIRIDGVVSQRSTTSQIRAGYIKSCTNDNGGEHTLNNQSSEEHINVAAAAPACTDNKNTVQLLTEEQKQESPNDGKLETSQPSSSFKLAKVWSLYDFKDLDRQFEPERTLNDKMITPKRCLNATKTNSGVQIPTLVTSKGTSITKSFLRAMSTLPAARPITMLKPSAEPSFNVTKRWLHPKINNRSNCAEWCGEDVCNLNRYETHLKKSMWLAPECYDRCEKPFRYDVVFMPGSNKETREYQQTWIECPPIRIVKKPVCCFEPQCLPPICRRPRKVYAKMGDKSTCEAGGSCKKEIPKNPLCIKVQEPCCTQKAREVPCCKIYPTPSCCQKRCTPYPSFSECCRPDSNAKCPVECLCLVKPTMCEVWADWRRKYMPDQYKDI